MIGFHDASDTNLQVAINSNYFALKVPTKVQFITAAK